MTLETKGQSNLMAMFYPVETLELVGHGLGSIGPVTLHCCEQGHQTTCKGRNLTDGKGQTSPNHPPHIHLQEVTLHRHSSCQIHLTL